MKMKMKMAGSLIVSFKGIFKNQILFLEPASRTRPFHSDSASMFKNITKLDDALHLFDEMTQRKPLPSVVKFTQLLQSVTKMKHYSCSIDLFKQMTAIGAPVNVYTTSIVIKCCCQMSCTNEGFAIVAYGFKRGVIPDVITFSTLLDGLILEDRILEAERLFKKLIKEEICEPNVFMYTTMIKGFCKFGNNDAAIGLLILMDERGCKANVFTYSTIIDRLCKDEMVDDALKLFNQMILHKGILPDVVTYNSLIQGLCNSGREDDASKMLTEMEAKRISPNVITYSILVDAFSKKGKVKDAKDVMNIMLDRGMDPNLVTYNSFIDGFCLQGEMKKAKGIFDVMKIIGPVPDIFTYNSLLNGYCKNLMMEEAMNLFHELTEKGMKPNYVTYIILLHRLLKNGQHDTIEMLLKEMDGSTLSILIRHISSRSFDGSLYKLIGNLLAKEGKEAPCIKSI